MFCDWEPPQQLLSSWVRRSDNQIMGLEILSIALGSFAVRRQVLHLCRVLAGISTFAEELRGRDVVIWSDNSGGEHSFKKGLPQAATKPCMLSLPAVPRNCKAIRSSFPGARDVETCLLYTSPSPRD